MRVLAVQTDIIWEDKPANHAVVETMLADVPGGVGAGSLIVLPELSDTGFSFKRRCDLR